MLKYPTCLVPYVLSCLTGPRKLRASVPQMLCNPCALVSHMLRSLVPHVLRVLRSPVPHVPRDLRALVPHLLLCFTCFTLVLTLGPFALRAPYADINFVLLCSHASFISYS